MSADDARILGFPAKWARRVLAASLIVNFLLIGVAVGVGVRVGDKPKRLGAGSIVHKLANIVGEDRRDEVRRILEERHDALKEGRSVVTENWRDVADYLEDPAFEAAALRAMLMAQSEIRNEGRNASMRSFADALDVLTAEERAALADEVRELVDRREDRLKRK